MEKNAGYTIFESVLFDNGKGIALGQSPTEADHFVTWQFDQGDERRDYYWGHYFDDLADARYDFNARVAEYKRRFGVHEVKRPISEQMKEAEEQAARDRGRTEKKGPAREER